MHSQQQPPAGHLANSSCTLIIYTEPAGATQIRASLRSLAPGQQVNGGEDVAAAELTAPMEGKSEGLPRNVEQCLAEWIVMAEYKLTLRD